MLTPKREKEAESKKKNIPQKESAENSIRRRITEVGEES